MRPPARLKGERIEIEKLMPGWRATTCSLYENGCALDIEIAKSSSRSSQNWELQIIGFLLKLESARSERVSRIVFFRILLAVHIR